MYEKFGIVILLLASILVIYAFGFRESPKVSGYVMHKEYHTNDPIPRIEMSLYEAKTRRIGDSYDTFYHNLLAKCTTDVNGYFEFAPVELYKKKSYVYINCWFPWAHTQKYWAHAAEPHKMFSPDACKILLNNYSSNMHDTLFTYGINAIRIEFETEGLNENDSARIIIGDGSKDLMLTPVSRKYRNPNKNMFEYFVKSNFNEEFWIIKGKNIPLTIKKTIGGKLTDEKYFINPGYDLEKLDSTKMKFAYHFSI